ncbi:MAG: AsmA-like C-terminal region-containing protein [Pseudomonadales bacterium]
MTAISVLCVFITGVLATLVYFPSLIIQPMEFVVSKRIGRDFNIDGSIEFYPGSESRVVVNDLRIVNPGWSRYSDLVTAKKIELGFDSMRLFLGSLELTNIVVHGVEIGLERQSENMTSWQFEPLNKQADDQGGEEGDSALLVSIGSASFFDIRLRYADFELSKPLDINIISLVEVNLQDDNLDYDLDALVNDIPLHSSGVIGPYANLFTGKDIKFDFQLVLRRLKLSGKGHIPDLTNAAGVDAEWKLQVPDIAELITSLGYKPFTVGNVDLVLQSTQEDGVNRFKANGNVGEFIVDTDALISSYRDWDKVDLQLGISGGSLDFLHDLVDLQCLPIDEFSLDLSIRKIANRIELQRLKFDSDSIDILLRGTVEDMNDLDSAGFRLETMLPDLSVLRCFSDSPVLVPEPAQFSLEFLLDRSVKERLKGQLSLLNTTIEFKGESIDFTGSNGMQIEISLESDDVSAVLKNLNIGTIGNLPVSMQAKAVVRPGNIEILAVNGRVEHIDFAAKGLLSSTPLSANIQLKLSSNTMRTLAKFADISALQNHSWSLTTNVHAAEPRVQLKDLNLLFGNVRLQANADIENPLSNRSLKLAGSLKSTNILDITEADLPDALSGKDFDFQFEFEERIDNGKSTITFNRLDFALGKTKLSLSLSDLQLNDPVGSYTAILSSKDLNDWSSYIPGYTFPDEAVGIELAGLFHGDDINIEKLVVYSADNDDFRVSAEGEFSLSELIGKLKIEGSGNKLSAMGTAVYFEISDQPFELMAELDVGNHHIKLAPLSFNLAGNEIRGMFSFIRGAPHKLNIMIEGEKLDLSSIDVDGDGNSQIDQKRFIPDMPVTGDLLHALDVQVLIDIATLSFRNALLKNFYADMVLRDGRLDIKAFKAESGRGSLRADGELILIAGGGVSMSGRIELDELIASIIYGQDVNLESAPRFSGYLDFSSEGDSTLALISDLNGAFRIRGSKGKIENKTFDRVGGDILAQVFAKINPLYIETDETEISCVALVGTIDDGVVNAEPGFVIQTDKLTVFTHGVVDLNSEEIDLDFGVRPTTGIGVSTASLANDYFKFGGTLMNPRLVVAPVSALVQGGTAMATGGLSIIATGIWQRTFADKKPCERFLKTGDNKSR